jgi:tRNA-specific 2-thiouridylase
VPPATSILVALSGGVDSSVAALMLRDQGWHVSGFTMSLATLDLDRGDLFAKAVMNASSVADCLGIPHHVVDVSDDFRREVIEPFVHAYAEGRTPNPCVRCNRALKFRTLIATADRIGATAVATGHYARVRRDAGGTVHLHSGVEASRDQSYFLYNLTQAQLQRVHFPIGEWDKGTVRAMARAASLPVADREDSQDICFMPECDYGEFVRTHYPGTLQPGAIKDTEGRELGRHEGIQFYTIGQRKGIGAHGARKFVVRIDSHSGDVVIGDNRDLLAAELELRDVNWIVPPPTGEFRAAVKIRSTLPAAPCTVVSGAAGLQVVFDEPQRAITPGQAGVVYVGDEVLGGGVIGSNQ